MNWHISFSFNALKFIKKNNLEEDFIVDKIKLVPRKFKGENVNVDIKKLSGKWEGFYRIRVGKLRIIVEFIFEQTQAYIEEIDYRGDAYK